MTLEETLEKIHPANQAAMAASLEHWSNIAMPLHSLGRLQDTVVRIAGMTGDPRVDLKKKALVVMCADNGVVEEGVTQSGQEVTKIVAENFLKEKATASILCKKAGADIFPVDIGIATDSTIIQHKVMYGTKNMAKEPAMTREQAIQGIEAGIAMAEELKGKGYQVLATGEMGIGSRHPYGRRTQRKRLWNRGNRRDGNRKYDNQQCSDRCFTGTGSGKGNRTRRRAVQRGTGKEDFCDSECHCVT